MHPDLTDPLEEWDTLTELNIVTNQTQQREAMWLEDFTLDNFAVVPSSFSPREAEKIKTSAPVWIKMRPSAVVQRYYRSGKNDLHTVRENVGRVLLQFELAALVGLKMLSNDKFSPGAGQAYVRSLNATCKQGRAETLFFFPLLPLSAGKGQYYGANLKSNSIYFIKKGKCYSIAFIYHPWQI